LNSKGFKSWKPLFSGSRNDISFTSQQHSVFLTQIPFYWQGKPLASFQTEQEVKPIVPFVPKHNAQITIQDVKKFSPEQLKQVQDKIIRLARPQLINHTWHQPKLSGKRVHALKKQFYSVGLPFPEIPKNKELKKGKNRQLPTFKPKGHAHQRDQLERLKSIEANLAKIPKQLEDIKKARREKEKLKHVKEATLWELATLEEEKKKVVKRKKEPKIRYPGQHLGGHRMFYKKK